MLSTLLSSSLFSPDNSDNSDDSDSSDSSDNSGNFDNSDNSLLEWLYYVLSLFNCSVKGIKCNGHIGWGN